MDTVLQWLAAIRAWPWAEFKSAAELVLYYLAVIAVLGCLLRLRTIAQVLRDFREARGPLWELQKTVSDLKTLEPAIQALGGHVIQVEEKVDAARKQVAELQVESTSTRTEAVDGSDVPQPPLPSALNGAAAEPQQPIEDIDEKNWQALRDHWRKNTERIEYVIDHKVLDGRTKAAYDRLPRTNYTRIVNKLQGQKFITAAAANTSRELIDLFNSYRPRNRTVPDEVVGGLAILSAQLDRELVPYDKVAAASLDDETASPPQASNPAAPNRPPNPGNGIRGAQNLPGSMAP